MINQAQQVELRPGAAGNQRPAAQQGARVCDLRPGAGQAPAARIKASGQAVALELLGSQGFTPIHPPDH